MADGKFKWQRPKFMGMSDFQEFVAEVEERVGFQNVDLLNDINLSMNSEVYMPCYLEVSEEKARELAADSNVGEERFFAYLSFLQEIEYRKMSDVKLCERKRSVVPCSDFLSPTKWQIRRRDFALFNMLAKIWNVSLVVAFAGAIPFMIGPVSNFISSGGCDFSELGGHSVLSVVSISVWAFFVFLFIITFSIYRCLRSKR
jgi:hypothetical protein